MKNTNWFSTKQIKDLYNIFKHVMAKDLPKLAKTYKDNLQTIVVLMKRKTDKPKITLNDLMKEIKSVKDGLMNEIMSVKDDLNLFKQEITTRLDKIEIRLDKHDEMFKQHGWIK